MAIDSEMKNVCGPECLRYVLEQRGCTASISDILKVTPHCPEGTTYLSLVHGAVAYGLNPCLLEITARRLERLLTLTGVPVIVAVRNSHFICITGFDSGQISVFDPNRGQISLSVDELVEQWDGRVLAFDRLIIHE